MKIYNSAILTIFILMITAKIADGKTMDEVEIGAVLCYDRLGPVDSIGVVTSKNYNRGTITIRYKNIFKKTVEKRFPIRKIKDPITCRVKSKAQRELLKALIDNTKSTSE